MDRHLKTACLLDEFLPYVNTPHLISKILQREVFLKAFELEKQLTYETFVEWTHPNRMKNTEVDVRLPRFKMEETYDLENVLTSMGMVDAFDVMKSDFSGMSETKELVLSKVTHKAFVEVNEAGTEAAAVSNNDLVEEPRLSTFHCRSPLPVLHQT